MTTVAKIEMTLSVIVIMVIGLFLAFTVGRLSIEPKYKFEAWMLYILALSIFGISMILIVI